MTRKPLFIIAGLWLASACSRSTVDQTDVVDCADSVRVVVAASPFCVYVSGVAPERCPPRVPNLVDYEGTPVCGIERRPDPRLVEAAVAAAFREVGPPPPPPEPDAGADLEGRVATDDVD